MARQPQQKGIPGLPPGSKLFAISQTKGLNTKETRSAIDDQELSWQENMIKIGGGNLRSVYDVGLPLYTPVGKTIIFFFPFNIGATFYHAVFLSDGTAVQVRESDGAVTTITAAANTFWQTGRERPGCSQWGALYLLIITVDGYWIWDGTTLYGAGTLAPVVQVTKAGSGYTSAPTVTASGGHGSGATFTATVSNGVVTGVTVTNPGSGYIAGDFVTLNFTGGGGNTTAIITATLTGQKVTGSTIVDAGTGYLVAPTLTIVGGGGSGATATCTVAAGAVNVVTITNQGDGYTSAPTIIVTAAPADNIKLAEAHIDVMPFGLVGTAIETFQSRVWITDKFNGNLTFSAPASFTAFNTAAGGGTVTSTDNFLKVGFPAIKQANGYLYPFGDSSIQVISNVQSGGSPVVTIFNNTNTDPQVGTPWRDTVQPYGRAIMFANEVGIYGLFGGTAEKQSEKLDGIFLGLPHRHQFTDIQEPSACLASIFDIRCYCCLIPIIDPFTGLQRNALMVWDGRTWFVASQTKSLTFVSTSWADASQPEPWGTDGLSLFPILNTKTDSLPKTWQTKLWAGTGFIVYKQALRAYNQVQDNSGKGLVIDQLIESDRAALSLQATNIGTFTWINNLGQAFTWTNNAMASFIWSAPFAIILGQNVDSMFGLLLGVTYRSSSQDFTAITQGILYVDDYSAFA